MTVLRANVLSDDHAWDRFVAGVKRLKAETGRNGVSTYDALVIWHFAAMNQPSPAGNPFGRNAAHGGPVFLPWHRFFLVILEQNLQRVLADTSFGLPYWDWAGDGELTPEQQRVAPIWSENYMGSEGESVLSGRFAFRPDDPNSWRVHYETTLTHKLVPCDRGLRREFSRTVVLPTRREVRDSLEIVPYDVEQWNTASASFRNALEGYLFESNRNALHNAVHAWIGGDMQSMTSPNDPVFFLHHSNVDRIWAAWQLKYPEAPYLPGADAPEDLQFHRIDDPMRFPYDDSPSPRQVLDVSELYKYDTFSDLL
jgi:tyrosinase